MLASRPANFVKITCLSFIFLTKLVLSLDTCQVDENNSVGPYLVGRTTVKVVDDKNTDQYPEREGRTFDVDIWYPAKEGSEEPLSQYDDVKAFGVTFRSKLARHNSEAADGSFPLLVFSHGFSGMRFESLTVMEHLASYGYIIASPDHSGNSALDIVKGTSSVPYQTRDRPLDASLVIDNMLMYNGDVSNIFFGRINEDKIGAMGHSMGSITTMWLAAGSTEDGPAIDDRVKAILPISPVAWDEASLSRVAIPTMVLSGSCDTATPVQPNTQNLMKASNGSPRYRVDIQGAGHTSFGDICFFSSVIQPLIDSGVLPAVTVELFFGAGTGLGYDGACTPNLRDWNQVSNLTITYSAAFFKTVFEEEDCSKFFNSSYATASNLPVDMWKCSGDAECEMEDEPEQFLGCGYTTAPTVIASPTESPSFSPTGTTYPKVSASASPTESSSFSPTTSPKVSASPTQAPTTKSGGSLVLNFDLAQLSFTVSFLFEMLFLMWD